MFIVSFEQLPTDILEVVCTLRYELAIPVLRLP